MTKRVQQDNLVTTTEAVLASVASEATMPSEGCSHSHHQGTGAETSQHGAIYTIGYGNRSLDEFAQLLKHYALEYLIDIRSAPYSKYNRDFSQEPLREALRAHAIKYVFMGKELGGQPDDEACYTADGRVDYAKLAETKLYNAGISRLHAAQHFRVVLMCSELRPHTCHRSKLIGATLAKHGVDVQHIDEHGNVCTQAEVMQLLMPRPPFQLELFEAASEGDLEPALTSRKSYRRRSSLP